MCTTEPLGQSALSEPIVFVSRQIPPDGSDFLPQSDADRAMPGVGGRERFRIASPGRLLVRESDGRIRVLVDGGSPLAASAFLIDVNAPAVSWDGNTIAFAGLPAPAAGVIDDRGSHAEPGRWRIFTIRADGSGLRQVTFDDPQLDTIDMASYLRLGQRYHYDDTDPAWLPDGRIVFSSTRWMSVALYGRARGTNLHVVNADGTGEHRITSERNGADRPVIDPVTGRIVYARWWLNGRFPSDRPDTIRHEDRGGQPSYELLNRLTYNPGLASGGPGQAQANEWIATSINPDGTDASLWSGSLRIPHFLNNYYGGTFSESGVLFGNFFPDFPLTESGGFGGIRRYHRGGSGSDPIWGLTRKTDDFVRPEPPQSLTIIKSATGYAADPVPLPDGRLLFSWARNPDTGAEDIGQDYGLFVLDPERPTSPTLVYDERGTTELRAQLLRPRTVPPVVPSVPFGRPTATPVATDADIQRDGAFEFDALNVYFNGPVDLPIVNAPPVGSAATIRFFADYQRSPLNADTSLNYPVLLAELPVRPDGAVRNSSLPANVPLFEDLRSTTGILPLTSHDVNKAGGAFVTGMNFGRPGSSVRCVGCHAGHTQIPMPASAEDARWTNLAPGATVTASSTSGMNPLRLVNRMAQLEEPYDHWRSQPGQPPASQWIELEFPVPIAVRSVRLHGPRNGIVVRAASVQLFADAARAEIAATVRSALVSNLGTNVDFADVTARVVRVSLFEVQGTEASLAEIEVVGAGVRGDTAAPPPPPPPPDTTPPTTPPDFLATLGAGNRPTLSWSASNDGPTGVVTGYVVKRTASGTTSEATVTGLSFVDAAALTGKAYEYSVAAVDGAGNRSQPTASVAVAVPADGPSPPTGLTASLDRANRPLLRWNDATSGSSIRRYRLRRNGTIVWSGSSSWTVDRQAQPGKRYSYVVEAQDRAGRWSAPSEPASITVPPRFIPQKTP